VLAEQVVQTVAAGGGFGEQMVVIEPIKVAPGGGQGVSSIAAAA
jgi:hypothetical protein